MLIEHGWAPSQFVALPVKEKILVMAMIEKAAKSRKRAQKGG
jgi:hypothetical protein